jgi:hypothetical protein
VTGDLGADDGHRYRCELMGNKKGQFESLVALVVCKVNYKYKVVPEFRKAG